MSQNDVSLPANRAFVIQLQVSKSEAGPAHRGRVEHITTGRAMHFPDENELWTFVDSILETECSEPSQPKSEADK